MARDCVVLFHEEFEGLGSFEPVLRKRGWEIRPLNATQASDLGAEAGTPDLLVILGGPMGVYEADRHPFLRQEITLASRRLAQDLPILGVCLGSQILAAALGSRVYPGPSPEIGWFPIELEQESRGDPIASHLVAESSTYLHWHGDTFDLPSGGVPLARSRLYRRQGFRWGRHGYALQFHLEVLPERIHEWTGALAAQLARTPQAQSAEQIEAGARGHGPAMVRQAQAFLAGYLDLVEAR